MLSYKPVHINKKVVTVYEIAGEYAIDAASGQNVYGLVHPELSQGHGVELDFSGVNVFASAFFNFAIGQLLSDISHETLDRHLEVKNLSDDGQFVLERVLDNAKRYYSDADYRSAVNTVMEEYASSF